ncbi:MAG: DmsE family decaheme c-type cytochrome [Bryobacteraceae bacterium]
MILTSSVRRMVRFPAGHPVLLLLIVSSVAVAGQDAKPPEAAEKPKVEAKTAVKAEYVGSETCQTCHEDISKGLLKNPHRIVETNGKRGMQGKACESCHGPGSKHAESADINDIISYKNLTPGQVDQRCLSCHLNQSTAQAGRIFGSHARNQVACTSCHGIHTAKTFAPIAELATPLPFTANVKDRGVNQARAPKRFPEVNQLCASCHPATWAEFQRPHSHPITQNAMSCVDCHNPHGSWTKRSMQSFSSNEPGCFKCHADKRGPFTFEHAPVRLEGCSTCHEPHGSANPRMLNRAQVMYQCLECHSNLPNTATQAAGTIGGVPPAVHDLRSPRFQNCTLCHSKIHGSYVDSKLTR